MKLHLARHSYHPFATMGWMHISWPHAGWLRGGERFATIEPPWRENRRNVSCIPEGTYSVAPYNSPRFPNCWEILDVPTRESILIHIGNWAKDTDGCVVVGMEPSPSALAVLRSAVAIERLREILAGARDMTITIDYQRG